MPSPRVVPRTVLAVALAGLAVLVTVVLATRESPKPHPAEIVREGNTTVYLDFHRRPDLVTPGEAPRISFFTAGSERPVVALTFDCAWVEESAGLKILDFLKDRGIRTTFFIAGPFIFQDNSRGLPGGLKIANFRLIRRMVEDGHEFGSHTWTHPRSDDTVDWTREHHELSLGWKAVVTELFGTNPPPNATMTPFWRAPYGQHDDRSLRLASRAGFPIHIGWTLDVHDALGLPACGADRPSDCMDARRMTDRILEGLFPDTGQPDGLVVLAHLQNPYDWTGTPDGMARLVDTLSTMGVTLRPVSEVFNWELAPDLRRSGH